ncbi:metallophosphoesterase [Pontibacter sp. HSC-36F09]|uniref:metallophosphoesterase n=1 Tax=Pontibacter sp. HSC-36F09 TaxID=2910966 RepID=UPI00209D96C2|nr:metallophosphoesterase [Pontibacter sp. HSC-36F09]MCP2043416.1 putative MPP superfamily phosphohydrolase [Pontibacter sp. HSC-36F09]
MQRNFSIGIVIFILFLVDLYVFQAVKTVTQSLSASTQRIIYLLYWAVFAITVTTFALASFTRGTPPDTYKTYLASTLFIIFASKLVVVLFLFVDDTLRLGKMVFNNVNSGETTFDPSRNKFLSQMGFMVAAVPFSAFIYGMVKGAYDYRVKRVTLRFPNLPAAFEGFKMLQISDLHTGSFTSTEPLKEAVRLINKQEADLVFFTGDIVNNIAKELMPHVDTLKEIRAKQGVFSVLGNHDYGDYANWDSREEKTQNLQTLIDTQRSMGWDVLLNENRRIEKDGEHIAVLGVENWGNRVGFPKYGDLNKAYSGSENSPFKVLLSHDPSHWDGEINQKYNDIDLTLSGHTHGMQFGVNIPGLKWSPVQYVYEQWAGLYKRGRQHLYVNTGLGFIGYPGRVGFLPEITVFELKKA